MKKLCNISLVILILTTIIIVGGCLFYNYQLSPVSTSNNTIELEIPNNTTARGIAAILKEKNLIRNEKFFLAYVKLMRIDDLKAGYYDVPLNLGVKKIVTLLQEGSKKNPNEIRVTFKEGINIRNLATTISENTSNSYESVLELMKDSSYLDEIIEKYWFLDDSIKNKELYYSLEGYLFPDTYLFKDNNVSVKEIFTKMLNKMEQVLLPYKEKIENSGKTVHQILTLASVIEKEGKNRDFRTISSTFHNRLNINMKLESCATGYYGAGLDFNELGIATRDVINAENAYNTYNINGLPIGPICLPSKNAIEATLTPDNTDYLFFLSDNQGITYFFNNYSEHQKKQQELIAAGKWYR